MHWTVYTLLLSFAAFWAFLMVVGFRALLSEQMALFAACLAVNMLLVAVFVLTQFAMQINTINKNGGMAAVIAQLEGTYESKKGGE